MDSSPAFAAPAALEESHYLRERLTPAPDDLFYLHLSDLKQALTRVLPKPGARVLDYGCGGSPYRSLFESACYHRADIPGIPNIDFVFGEDS